MRLPPLLKRLRLRPAAAVALAAAVVTLVAVVSYWPLIEVSTGTTLPGRDRSAEAVLGARAAAGAEISAEQEAAISNFLANAAGTFSTSGVESPPEGLTGLVVAAALLAGCAAVYTLVRPGFETTRRQLTLIAGVLGATYFVYFLRIQLDVMDALGDASVGFWMAAAGTAGLFVQHLIPRSLAEPDGRYIRISASAISGRPTTGIDTASLWQNLLVAFDALFANKLRAALTMLGIIIGVGSIVALLSVGQGAQDSVTDRIESIGANIITISPLGRPVTLVEADAAAIEQAVPGLEAVLPEYSASMTVQSDITSTSLTVLGVTSDYAGVEGLEVQAGRLLSEADYADRERVAVVGTSVVEDLFNGINPVGQTIQISTQRFQVIGVLEQQDSGGGQDPNARIYVPLSTGYRYLFTARAVASNDRTLTSMTVAVADRDNIDAAMAQIEAVLQQTHELDEDDDNDFRVFSQTQLLETVTSVTETFTVLLAALASVSLVVGGIGIMNISLVSVTERTKEIGLRKALGAKRYHILQQFLIETTVMSALGGLLGVGSGAAIAYIANATGELAATVTWQSVALGLGSAVITGMFFGVYPASRAAALEPIEALRYE